MTIKEIFNSGLAIAAVGALGTVFYLLGPLPSPSVRNAIVNCQPYNGKIELTKAFIDEDNVDSKKENETHITFTADTVCRAETDLGTVVAHIDSQHRFRGYSHLPSEITSGRLPNVENLKSKAKILSGNTIPCTPTPDYIGLDKADGVLVKYVFEPKVK